MLQADNMTSIDWALVIAAAGFLLNLVLIVVGGVWSVGQIKSRADAHFARFDATITNLASSVDRVAAVAERMNMKLNDHATRITVLETKDSMNKPGPG